MGRGPRRWVLQPPLPLPGKATIRAGHPPSAGRPLPPHADPPQFNAVALQIGPGGNPLVRHASSSHSALPGSALRVRLAPFANGGWTRRDVEDMLFYGVLGVVIGGRLGYVLFYKPGHYAANPLEIFAVWKGGMSHGGMLGVLAAMALFARRRRPPFLEVLT